MKWTVREEREELKKDIERIKEKELEEGNKRKMEDTEWRDRKREGSIEGRFKEMERNMERREKEKRTKNIIMRGVEIRKGKRRKADFEDIRGKSGNKRDKENRRND